MYLRMDKSEQPSFVEKVNLHPRAMIAFSKLTIKERENTRWCENNVVANKMA